MKYFVVFLVNFLFVSSAMADHLNDQGVLYSDNIGWGSFILYKNYKEALSACPSGTHLPSIRELAEEAKDFGAKGILQRSVDPNNIPPGYTHFLAVNAEEAKDDFYYSNDGYKDEVQLSIGGGPAPTCVWSSSEMLTTPSDVYAMLLETCYGAVDYGDILPGAKCAIQCFQNR